MSEDLFPPPGAPAPRTPPPDPSGRLKGRGIGILRPLRIRNFRLMWTGLTVSLLGDGIFFVAIAWQTYRLSNVPTALSLVGFSWSLPMVLFVLVGGVMSDRFDRRWVLVTADVIRRVSLTLMGVLAITGAMELWHLVALAAVGSFLPACSGASPASTG